MFGIGMAEFWFAVVVVFAALGVGLGRDDYWGPRARGRYRLTAFAEGWTIEQIQTPVGSSSHVRWSNSPLTQPICRRAALRTTAWASCSMASPQRV
jgi:hypothetical protein